MRQFRSQHHTHQRPKKSAGILLTFAALAAAMVVAAGNQSVSARSDGQQFRSSVASPQVHTLVTLGDHNLHPHQLAYDPHRNGIWFWTSEQQHGTTFSNVVYFYDIGKGATRSWPIYSGDWSSQVLAGLAVAPDGDVWIGWNLNLVDFHPTTGTYVRYVLPPNPKYPLPPVVVGNLPSNLGISDIAISQDGTIWIARYGDLSLTAFSPARQVFTEYPLPSNSGDPARLAIMPSGHIVFTTNFAADHPGYGAETMGEFNPSTGKTWVYAQPALAVAVTPGGDIFSALGGNGHGLARLTATEHNNAMAEQRAPVFQQHVLSFNVDDTSMASDLRGRIWIPVANQPQIALFDPRTDQAQIYQYAAPSIAANPAINKPYGVPTLAPSSPSAVWITPIVSMTTDGQGHLWYVRAGYSMLEEVSA